MKKVQISFADTRQFPELITDYFSGNEKIRPFYKYPPDIKSFGDIINERNTFNTPRTVLHQVLLNQYKNILKDSESDQKVLSNIELLKSSNTYTVTTGHQLNLLTGPLYKFYKIFTVIRLAEDIQKHYPGNKIVPVYWMASEDHDIEEINHVFLKNKNYEWNIAEKGPAGRLKITGIKEVLDEIEVIPGINSSLLNAFRTFYLESDSLGEAERKIFHYVFGKYGLVILDGDSPELKKCFIPEMEDDIFYNTPSKKIQETADSFTQYYKLQVQPRDINLFYIEDHFRERIIKSGQNEFVVNNSDIKFTGDQIKEELHNFPWKFSPNVVLRPLYQEKLLPNLAYVGGPGELNYWLEYKTMFGHYKIPFPVLMLRNCIMFIDKVTSRKIDKLGLEKKELFASRDELIEKIIADTPEFNIDFDINARDLTNIYDRLIEKALKIDVTLKGSFEAEKQKAGKGMEVLKEKTIRALKRKNEVVVNQINSMKDRLFPNETLQERHDNILSFPQQDFIDILYQYIDPFEKHFIILEEE